MKHQKNGFTLIELMIVVAIISFLAMIAVPSFARFISKSKRAEAYMNLGSIYTAQKTYWAENNTYTSALRGVKSANWQPEGYNGGGARERFYYTYGFSEGTEGRNYFTGKLKTSSSELRNTKAEQDKFTAAAAGDIDGDGQADILLVNQFNKIDLVQDDLA